MRKMKFEKFVNKVAGSIREYLPSSYCDANITLNEVKKNNDLKLTGLSIRMADSNICPTIYLEQFYRDYQNGKDMDEILAKIADVRMEHETKQQYDVSSITDFTKVKNKIFPRIINAKWNTQILEERPHIMLLDLAVTYFINMGNDMVGCATIPVTNGLMTMWNITIDELHTQALDNMQNDVPSRFETMGQAIGMDLGDDDMMYVLTNSSKRFGATAVLDESIMMSIAERLGDIYIIPSSIHEVLIIRASDTCNAEELNKMVCDVNAGVVDCEDRLSNHVYGYSVSDGIYAI